MLSKNLIKSYDFKTREDYFNYIVESITNGQREQGSNLISKLSKSDKAEALTYLKDMTGEDSQEAQKFIIQSLKTEETRKEAIERLKEYRENERGTAFRLIKKRIKITF